MITLLIGMTRMVYPMFMRDRPLDREEHQEFLQLLAYLVEKVPREVVRAFGTLDAPIYRPGRYFRESSSIELTGMDLMYWQTLINKEGGRIHGGAHRTSRALWNGLNSAMSSLGVSNQEQLKLARNAPGYQGPTDEGVR